MIYRNIESELRDTLNWIVYGLSNNFSSDYISTRYRQSSRIIRPRGRVHNYQRDLLSANRDIQIMYKGTVIAVVESYPKRVIRIVTRLPEQSGYLASKILEKILYYDFRELEVKRNAR